MQEMTETTPSPRLPQELACSPLFLLKRLGFAAKERSLAAYADVGLGPYHHAVLAVLAEGPPETQGAIADALGYDRGQLVGLMDDLEELALVERRRDPRDRRRHTVSLTPDGRRMLTKLRALAARVEDEFLSDLDDSKRDQLFNILRRLAQSHLPNCASTTST